MRKIWFSCWGGLNPFTNRKLNYLVGSNHFQTTVSFKLRASILYFLSNDICASSTDSSKSSTTTIVTFHLAFLSKKADPNKCCLTCNFDKKIFLSLLLFLWKKHQNQSKYFWRYFESLAMFVKIFSPVQDYCEIRWKINDSSFTFLRFFWFTHFPDFRDNSRSRFWIAKTEKQQLQPRAARAALPIQSQQVWISRAIYLLCCDIGKVNKFS